MSIRSGFNFQDIVIWSGGQSGVDMAALDAALEQGVRIGGFAPCGWVTEYGFLPKKYRFNKETGEGLKHDKAPVESDGQAYLRRAERNVLESDVSIIFSRRPMSGGTRRTYEFCKIHKKRNYLIRINTWRTSMAGEVARWLSKSNAININIAGPRESKEPGIYDEAFEIITQILEVIAQDFP